MITQLDKKLAIRRSPVLNYGLLALAVANSETFGRREGFTGTDSLAFTFGFNDFCSALAALLNYVVVRPVCQWEHGTRDLKALRFNLKFKLFCLAVGAAGCQLCQREPLRLRL